MTGTFSATSNSATGTIRFDSLLSRFSRNCCYLRLMTVEIRVIVAALVFWLSWRLLRSLVSGRSLDNVAGPPSKSFWKGQSISARNMATVLTSVFLHLTLGNFKELFSPDGWAFHDAIAKQCTFASLRINDRRISCVWSQMAASSRSMPCLV